MHRLLEHVTRITDWALVLSYNPAISLCNNIGVYLCFLSALRSRDRVGRALDARSVCLCVRYVRLMRALLLSGKHVLCVCVPRDSAYRYCASFRYSLVSSVGAYGFWF